MIESGLFLAEAAMFLIVPPCFTILAGVTMPNMRGVGFGVALAAGARPGRPLVAHVDGLGHRHLRPARLHGHGLRPVPRGPRRRCRSPSPGTTPRTSPPACSPSSPPCSIAGIVLLAGIRHLPRELALMIAKLRAAPTLASRPRIDSDPPGKPRLIRIPHFTQSTNTTGWMEHDD